MKNDTNNHNVFRTLPQLLDDDVDIKVPTKHIQGQKMSDSLTSSFLIIHGGGVLSVVLLD